MAGKQIGGEGLPANIAGMSKNQLYEIMSQMKALSLSIFYFISFSFVPNASSFAIKYNWFLKLLLYLRDACSSLSFLVD
ncbi:hypothetical protein Gohar_006791 [Gossypium harknessii]|uniref:Uncharacterized protein n=1 Tax=Gossypium harknessii TaxID=34285 RepID=A0A7J9GEH8_9ROSI|nr:hypothetical protein [Gossypium harknessii]